MNGAQKATCACEGRRRTLQRVGIVSAFQPWKLATFLRGQLEIKGAASKRKMVSVWAYVQSLQVSHGYLCTEVTFEVDRSRARGQSRRSETVKFTSWTSSLPAPVISDNAANDHVSPFICIPHSPPSKRDQRSPLHTPSPCSPKRWPIVS